MTIYDFELDVKKGGQCNDFLEVSSGSLTYFKDCGGLGKQELKVDANNALVHFHASPNSLTQRGFFIHFEGLFRLKFSQLHKISKYYFTQLSIIRFHMCSFHHD